MTNIGSVSVKVTTNVEITENKKQQNNTSIVIDQSIKINTDDLKNSNIKKGKVPIGDNTVSFVKKVSSGALIGGGSFAVLNPVGRALITDTFSKPTAGAIGMGTAIGTGIALINTNVGSDKKMNTIKNSTGAALIGAGGMGTLQAIGKALITDKALPASFTGVIMGGALVGGITLANSDIGNNKTDKLSKNIISGTLIGAGGTSVATGLAKSIFTNIPQSASIGTIALGAALGTGIALANNDIEGGEGIKLSKNAISGALIGGGAIGIGSALFRTIGTDIVKGPSITSIAIATAIGTGIGILATKTDK